MTTDQFAPFRYPGLGDVVARAQICVYGNSVDIVEVDGETVVNSHDDLHMVYLDDIVTSGGEGTDVDGYETRARVRRSDWEEHRDALVEGAVMGSSNRHRVLGAPGEPLTYHRIKRVMDERNGFVELTLGSL